MGAELSVCPPPAPVCHRAARAAGSSGAAGTRVALGQFVPASGSLPSGAETPGREHSCSTPTPHCLPRWAQGPHPAASTPHSPGARPAAAPAKALAPPWGICSRSRAKGGRAGCGVLRAASPPHVPSHYSGPAASTGLQQPGGVGAVGRMRAARAPQGPSAFLQPYGRAASTRPEVSAGFNTVSDTPAGPPPDRPGPLGAFHASPAPRPLPLPAHGDGVATGTAHGDTVPRCPPAPSHAPAWQRQPSPLSYCHSRLLRHREAPRQHTKGKIRL